MKKPHYKNLQLTGIAAIKIQKKYILAVFCLILFLSSVLIGAYFGYFSGMVTVDQLRKIDLAASLGEQYILAEKDLAEGRYDIAQKRYVYILEQDPKFPGAEEKLVEALKGLKLTNPINTTLPTPTLTPTPNPRPIEELYSEAINLINQQQWQKAIDILGSLRKSDQNYQVSKVDGFMYLALRYLGVEKIMKMGDLEGGSYDLALAEKFGPLDAEANSALNLARLYMYGLSFWEVMPEQAIYYFGQVANAAPYLQDSSGWIARNRYRAVLIQYGDQLAAKDKSCQAVEQYVLAWAIQEDIELQKKMKDASDICSPPTKTPSPPTMTATSTQTQEIIITPTLQPVSTTQVPTQVLTQIPTTQIPPTNTALPVIPTTESPSPTSEPTQALVPTETPVSTQLPAEVPTQTPSA